MRIALAQIDSTVGDIDGNLALCLNAADQAAAAHADILLLPELALLGYPPEDLLAKPHFMERSMEAAETFARLTPCPALVGFAFRDSKGTFNAAAFCRGGVIERLYRKQLLPNYGVFDEERYFEPGLEDVVVEIVGVWCGITVCEDAWFPEPAARVAQSGAQVLLNISASPFHVGKGRSRESMLRDRAASNNLWFAYCNVAGGQDELVFDGRSVVIAPNGGVIARARAFAEDFLVVDIDPGATKMPVTRLEPIESEVEEMYDALRLGLRDYIRKNGFSDVVIGLSGGIDSALTAVLAVDALGAEHVHGVLMPSRFSSEGSVADAEELAELTGIDILTIPIEEPFAAIEQVLAPTFGDLPEDVTEENLQARIRGVLLMALSNKFNWLVLATGNKSELSVGYSTLYGDMVGGFAPIKDVFKTKVYDLARWRNQHGQVIPVATIEKPPSAELRPDQTDQDSLPPYDVLDAILVSYVEQDHSAREIIASGQDEKVVRKVIGLVDAAEYKRRQGPIGIKITPKAFGKDRRMPITNRFGG
ncbi:MAG: NAD+ synthase [Actinobacteria bacterium HGW-Actinobacteria-1]|jgi:NAD+ synthase (glutamine-hydrolysing)|nr:MAG: NAD+ synthase [Actinobacteria bacterium HGW-Actinobacteria-1]